MRIYHVIVLVFIIFICGCKSEFDLFNEQALAFTKDKKIDEKEYHQLLALINGGKGASFETFKTNGKIDQSKVLTYLERLFNTKSLPLTSADIWQEKEVSDNKFNINVFLENSASIDGYVDENSSFKTTIFKLLTDLKNFPSSDSLNLNYINTRPIPVKMLASNDDIKDFYQRLNPADFRSAGGVRSSSDIEMMIKELLGRVNEKNLSIFISDCVFSPGSRDAKKFLDGQYAALYNDFITARRNNADLSVIILQCMAKFEGTYFDCFDHPHPNVSTERPYYIWFLGTSGQIKDLIDNKIFELIKNGYKNKLVIQPIKEIGQPAYKILYSPRIGDFDLESLNEGIITEPVASGEGPTKGLFGFNVAVDFSKTLQDPDYFMDTSNYTLSNKHYNLGLSTITDKSDPSLNGFTHILKLKTSELKGEVIKVNIIGKTPSWVYESTSGNDAEIETDVSEGTKTFGFRYLVDGVCDAFFPRSNENIVNSISITIKK